MIHLFRPLVKTDFINSPVNPRKKCIHAAEKVSRISDDYRKLFSMRTVIIFWTRVLLTSATVQLLDLLHKAQSPGTFTDANRSAFRNVSLALDYLSSMLHNHAFAARCFMIIRGIIEQNDQLLPDVELKRTPQRASVDSAAPVSLFKPSSNNSPTLTSFESTVDEARTRASRAFALRLPENTRTRVDNAALSIPHTSASDHTNAVTSTPFTPIMSSLPPQHAQDYQHPLVPYAENTTLPQASYGTPIPSTTNPEPSPFWTPFQGQGLPLYNQNINMSPMNVTNLLGHVDVCDQLGRDGFRMSEVWGQDPMFGANRHAHIDLTQQGQ
jgi:hypothetical protein